MLPLKNVLQERRRAMRQRVRHRIRGTAGVEVDLKFSLYMIGMKRQSRPPKYTPIIISARLDPRLDRKDDVCAESLGSTTRPIVTAS
jgi:hypothetical protein